MTRGFERFSRRAAEMLCSGALIALLSLVPSAAAEEVDEAQAPPARERVFGSELMTEAERAEHRARMRSFATEEEREAYRREHHAKMQERAKQRGVELPEEPLERRRGAGMGPAGPGRGSGAGGAGPRGAGR